MPPPYATATTNTTANHTQGAYFGERLVARDDYPQDENSKSLYRLFPDGISMALILDDNPNVWQGEQFRHLLPLR